MMIMRDDHDDHVIMVMIMVTMIRIRIVRMIMIFSSSFGSNIRINYSAVDVLSVCRDRQMLEYVTFARSSGLH